jgi:hypothetical protein
MGQIGSKKTKISLLGSSQGQEIGTLLQVNLGTEYMVTSILKPNVPLANVAEDLGKLCKGLTKQDHFVKVRWPGNSLDRNYHYSMNKDINFIAERTRKKCGIYKRLQWHDMLWMNRKVRSVNLQLDRGLMGHRTSLISVTDTAPIVTEECTTNNLHLNSQGKRKLMHLIANRIGDDHVLSVSSIPVITHATTSLF